MILFNNEYLHLILILIKNPHKLHYSKMSFPHQFVIVKKNADLLKQINKQQEY